MAGPVSSSTVRDDAIAILRRLREAGHVAYFAGGCVRDELLGHPPLDYDVATDAHPDKVRSLFRNTQAVGAAFGVILIRTHGGQVEVATFRSDGPYDDGRRPSEVTFTTAQQDAQRRDFTINGLFLDPLNNEVIDYVGGRDDLASHTLRAIGNPDDRFAEDHLRMLRAVRFAARFGLHTDPATAAAIVRHAQSLKRISPERIADELRLTLTAATRNAAFQLLEEFGLLNVILRFLPEEPTEAPADNFTLFPLLDDPAKPMSFGLALAAISLGYRMRNAAHPDPIALTDTTSIKQTTAALRQALKISNDEEAALAGALAFGALLQGGPPTVATIKRFLAKSFADDARRLMHAVAQRGFSVTLIASTEERLERLSREEVAPTPFVTGDDLVKLGLRPGPQFKIILDRVYDAQLENAIHSPSQALAMAKEMAGNA
jgi:poly(A) polymerase